MPMALIRDQSDLSRIRGRYLNDYYSPSLCEFGLSVINFTLLQWECAFNAINVNGWTGSINKTTRGEERVPRNDRRREKSRGWKRTLIRFPPRRMNELERRSRKRQRIRGGRKSGRSSGRSYTFYRCVCVCARNYASRARKKGKRIERETKRWRRERERERSKEAKWEGKKFVTAKRNGGPRKNSERRGEREGDRIDFHCRLKIQWAARERVRAADSRIENRIRGGEGGGKTDGRTWKISFVRAGVQTSACKSAGHCQEDCQFESNRID